MAATTPSTDCAVDAACPAAAAAAPSSPEDAGATKTKSFSAYVLNKCIVGYGIINGIINAAIFAGIHAGAPEALFRFREITGDMALTGALLGMLLFVIVVPLTKADFRKGRFGAPSDTDQLAPLPRSFILATIVMGAVALVAAVGIANAACLLLPLPLDVTQMMLLKGACCATVGCLSGYFTISWVVRTAKDC